MKTISFFHDKRKNIFREETIPTHGMYPVLVMVEAKELFHVEASEVAGHALAQPGVGPAVPGEEAAEELVGHAEYDGLPGLVHLVDDSTGA